MSSPINDGTKRNLKGTKRNLKRVVMENLKQMGFERLNYSPAEAGALLDCGRTTIYKLIADGSLGAKKIGRGTKIPHAELVRYQNELMSRSFVPVDVSKAVAAQLIKRIARERP